MKYFRKFLCWLLGHQSICLGHDTHIDPNNPELRRAFSFSTHWKCERCGHTFTEGWDV